MSGSGKNTVRAYVRFAQCGLNCGLCPRHHTAGASRCPGCAGEGFGEVHPRCGILTCGAQHGTEYCALCADYPCARYAAEPDSDSFISYRGRRADMERARSTGIGAYRAALDEKVALLETLLARYDDGRHKTFLCNAVNLLDLETLRTAAARMEEEIDPEQSPGKRAAHAQEILRQTAQSCGVQLALRKKEKKGTP